MGWSKSWENLNYLPHKWDSKELTFVVLKLANLNSTMSWR
jgi:hypothetical protein